MSFTQHLLFPMDDQTYSRQILRFFERTLELSNVIIEKLKNQFFTMNLDGSVQNITIQISTVDSNSCDI